MGTSEERSGAASEMAEQQGQGLWVGGLREGYAEIGDVFIWGQDDRYLGSELAEPDHDDVPNLDRVERLPDASHWVHHDEPERVTRLLTDFAPPARAAQY
jgi:pimeloyl-ACP methyl ester carboxylesterase